VSVSETGDDGGGRLPPGYHLIPATVPDRSQVAEAARGRLAALVAADRYAEAAALARTLADEVLLFGPCEEIADQVLAHDAQLAERLYWLAARTHQLEGFWATAGGEGLAAVAARDQVLAKLVGLHRTNRGE